MAPTEVIRPETVDGNQQQGRLLRLRPGLGSPEEEERKKQEKQEVASGHPQPLPGPPQKRRPRRRAGVKFLAPGWKSLGVCEG